MHVCVIVVVVVVIVVVDIVVVVVVIFVFVVVIFVIIIVVVILRSKEMSATHRLQAITVAIKYMSRVSPEVSRDTQVIIVI